MKYTAGIKIANHTFDIGQTDHFFRIHVDDWRLGDGSQRRGHSVQILQRKDDGYLIVATIDLPRWAPATARRKRDEMLANLTPHELRRYQAA